MGLIRCEETFYETVEALQADLDAWLNHYNIERPRLGYRNQRDSAPKRGVGSRGDAGGHRRSSKKVWVATPET